MLFHPQHENPFDQLTEKLRLAPKLDVTLFTDVISNCARLPTLLTAGKAARIDRLIAAGAWTDAAVALIELELRGWKLRRLIYDDGEWFCSLSAEPNLPVGFDDTADARHEVLPIAILSAFLEARRRVDSFGNAALRRTRSVDPILGQVVCCDNFA